MTKGFVRKDRSASKTMRGKEAISIDWTRFMKVIVKPEQRGGKRKSSLCGRLILVA